MNNKDFLNDFTKRMRSVGRYAVLIRNSVQKTTWKQYKIESFDEQLNMIYTVLLFIMENSLKEEECTIDDISMFISEVDDYYYHRGYSYKEYRQLADFIVNVILGNSGTAMYFKGYNYENKQYEELHISYIANKIIYKENGIRRTSYYLTDEGYNMMLSTMELENNLKLTVHDMLFKLHLEKADYSRAVNDIKNVFDQLRIQNQKIQEAMHRIRQNALAYTVEEYHDMVEENIATIEKTRSQFRLHKEVVEVRVREYEEREINAASFNEKDKEGLNNLRIINMYLNKSLDEHQKILNEHFDLKTLYDMELENYSGMNMVQRYNFRSEIYDNVLKNASLLEHVDTVLRPLLWNSPAKIYNPNKAFEYQSRIKNEEPDDGETVMDFDEEKFREEQKRAVYEKMEKYNKSCAVIMQYLHENQEISLSMLKEQAMDEHKDELFPTVEIFREIMIEMLTEGTIDIELLRKEKRTYMTEVSETFQLNETLLDIVERSGYRDMKKIKVQRSPSQEKVLFDNVVDENGHYRRLKCSDIIIRYE